MKNKILNIIKKTHDYDLISFFDNHDMNGLQSYMHKNNTLILIYDDMIELINMDKCTMATYTCIEFVSLY